MGALLVLLFSAVLAFCRIAFAAETGGIGGHASGFIETIVTVYGPMGGMLLWFMYRERKRDDREADRDKSFVLLVQSCTATMTEVRTVLGEMRGDLQKHRHAVYQLERAVLRNTGEDNDDDKGKTRIMRKDE